MPLTSPTNSIPKTSFSLPPITKVFPGHFGSVVPLPTKTAKRSERSEIFNYSNPKRGQNQNLTARHLGPFNNFNQAVPFVNGNYPVNSCAKLRNKSINFDPNSISYGHLSQQNYQQQQQQDLFYNYPQHYTQAQAQAQIDRKKSYHQQGPGTLISEFISLPVHIQSSQSKNLPLPQAQAHNFVSFSIDTLSRPRNSSQNSIQGSVTPFNTNGSNKASNLNLDNNVLSHNQPGLLSTQSQNKLNFRNFAIQMSSKSTNLTSNQAGTAAADKQHFSAIMQDCVIVSSVDYINSFKNYRPTVNNKLKSLKFNEFIQEQLHFRYNGSTASIAADFTKAVPVKDDLIYFYKTPETFLKSNPSLSRFKIFRHSRTLGIAVYRKGERIFPVSPEDISDFWTRVPENVPLQGKERSINDFRDEDLIMICRGYPENEVDSLAEDISKVQLGGDLDDVLPPSGHIFDYLLGESATIAAIIGSEFDEFLLRGTDNRIKHVLHVEKNGHVAIDGPWPYAITKHTVVHRPYLAMLFSDASKINRFSPTIEFVLKKAMTVPIGQSILKSLEKLSEIHHMVGAMVIGNKLRYWATGGAILALVSSEEKNSKSFVDWNVSFPGVTTWISSSFDNSHAIPIGEIDVKSGDFILLCCPEIRHAWKQAEVVSIIKSDTVWPEKFHVLANRFKKERNSKSGLGLFEITLK